MTGTPRCFGGLRATPGGLVCLPPTPTVSWRWTISVTAPIVGDSPRNDIMGPQTVGLRAALLPTGHARTGEKPDAVLADLRAVLTLK